MKETKAPKDYLLSNKVYRTDIKARREWTSAG